VVRVPLRPVVEVERARPRPVVVVERALTRPAVVERGLLPPVVVERGLLPPVVVAGRARLLLVAGGATANRSRVVAVDAASEPPKAARAARSYFRGST
jgi:hypothetical protein